VFIYQADPAGTLGSLTQSIRIATKNRWWNVIAPGDERFKHLGHAEWWTIGGQERVLFSAQRPNDVFRLFTCDLNGGDLTQLTFGPTAMDIDCSIGVNDTVLFVRRLADSWWARLSQNNQTIWRLDPASGTESRLNRVWKNAHFDPYENEHGRVISLQSQTWTNLWWGNRLTTQVQSQIVRSGRLFRSWGVARWLPDGRVITSRQTNNGASIFAYDPGTKVDELVLSAHDNWRYRDPAPLPIPSV
jgi:Tol biopolymer transport system component